MSSEYLVIDASIGWRLFTPHPDWLPLEHLLTKQRGGRFIVPTLWRYETTSILAKALHFNQLTDDEVKAAIRLSSRFAIELVPPDNDLAVEALAWTKRLRRMATYDSFYLALAQRMGSEALAEATQTDLVWSRRVQNATQWLGALIENIGMRPRLHLAHARVGRQPLTD